MKRLIVLSVTGLVIAVTTILLIRLGPGAAPAKAQEPLVTMTPVERQAFADLDARPIQNMRNTDLGQYLPLRQKAIATDGLRFAANEEIGRMGRRAVGQAFRLNAVQFDLAEGDCVSFVNRTLALALAKDWDSYYLLIERIRHKDGVVEYKNRNFFTLGDWLPNNAWLLDDVTAQLGPAENRPAQSFTHVVRPKVFDERPAAPGSAFTRITFKGSDYKSPDKETRTDSYVPTERIPEVLRDLRTGDVVLILRPANGGHLGCDHMGLIAVAADGQVNILHSAPRQVREEPLTGFLERCNWISGLKFLRLKDNARELAAQQVTAMTGQVTVPPPAEQDAKNDTLRANRATSD
ncbi:MAG TPA: DUF1460 domain-containing protein [Phycisphaerae bacterium]|nr:DUF1460 domain-containing protein [Phycisphaerae bacterium]